MTYQNKAALTDPKAESEGRFLNHFMHSFMSLIRLRAWTQPCLGLRLLRLC